MFAPVILFLCCDVVSLGGKYVFATVIFLPMCILISCSSVLCVC